MADTTRSQVEVLALEPETDLGALLAALGVTTEDLVRAIFARSNEAEADRTLASVNGGTVLPRGVLESVEVAEARAAESGAARDEAFAVPPVTAVHAASSAIANEDARRMVHARSTDPESERRLSTGFVLSHGIIELIEVAEAERAASERAVQDARDAAATAGPVATVNDHGVEPGTANVVVAPDRIPGFGAAVRAVPLDEMSPPKSALLDLFYANFFLTEVVGVRTPPNPAPSHVAAVEWVEDRIAAAAPERYAFSAWGHVEDQPALRYHAVRTDTDGAYDAATGVVTAPRAGTYVVAAQVRAQSDGVLHVDVNGAEVGRASAPGQGALAAVHVVVVLQAGDAVRVRPSSSLAPSARADVSTLLSIHSLD